MADSKKYIGHTAQLCNLVAKPELNGSYVIVGSFDSEKERYGVRTLVPPTAVNAVSLSLAVKLTSLQFCVGETFADRFPAASVVQASMLRNDIKAGTILDFSQSQPASMAMMEQMDLVFDASCRCVGAPSVLSNTGEARPTTVMQNDTCVEFNGNGIVEFEDINFDNILPTGGFAVSKANQVTFRRCRFRGANCGIALGMNQERCNALFENCLFENNPCDVLVLEHGTVTMINCVLRGPVMCARIMEGGRFTAIHCTFYGGIQALDKVPHLELINCKIVGSFTNGITIANGSTARLQGCRVIRCRGEGIVVKGPKRSTIHIEDCVVTESNMGYLCEMGKVDAVIRNSDAFNNTFHGLHLGNALSGSVTVENCKFTNNHGAMDFVNLCGPECPVTIDGVQQPLAFDFTTFKRVMVDIERLAKTDIERNGECRVSLDKRRATKKAQSSTFGNLVAHISCLSCNKPEPVGVKFKACAKCKEVVYCSRECQVAHWKEHKKQCGKVEYA